MLVKMLLVNSIMASQLVNLDGSDLAPINFYSKLVTYCHLIYCLSDKMCVGFFLQNVEICRLCVTVSVFEMCN